MDDGLLEGQLAYYRARAGEYDEWFLRTGRNDRGPNGIAGGFSNWSESAGNSAGSGRREGCSSSRAAPVCGRWSSRGTRPA